MSHKKFIWLFTAFMLITIEVAADIIPFTVANTDSAWTIETPLPEAAADLKTGVVNNRIFVFGPHVTYEYNLASWIEKQPMPSSRDYFATATYKDRVYCIGGRSNGPSAANEAYNPASNSWEIKQAMPTPRHGLEANVVNDKIYLIGGMVPDDRWPNVNVDAYTTYRSTNVTEEYDPSTDTWTSKAPIPQAAAHYSSAVINNKIYIFSDHYNQNSGIYEALTQIYDPSTDTWGNGNPPPYAVDMAGSTAFSNSNYKRIYLIGGRGSGLEVAYNQIYDISTDSWSRGAALPTARYGLTVCNLDNKIYTFGGYQGAYVTVKFRADNEVYDPSQDKPIQVIPSTTPTSTFTIPSLERNAPHLDPIYYLIPVSVITAVIVITLLIYKRHRKTVMSRNVDLT
jgi:N-acetylneuraminic acid mutarotase